LKIECAADALEEGFAYGELSAALARAFFPAFGILFDSHGSASMKLVGCSGLSLCLQGVRGVEGARYMYGREGGEDYDEGPSTE
jgi:hypothetical protein